jgi:hypothetical protein
MNGNGRVSHEARGWLVLGAEGFCYDVSDSLARMLGQPKAAFLVSNWFHLVYIEDREVVRVIANVLQRNEIPEACSDSLQKSFRSSGLAGSPLFTETGSEDSVRGRSDHRERTPYSTGGRRMKGRPAQRDLALIETRLANLEDQVRALRRVFASYGMRITTLEQRVTTNDQ